jgi:hypothetical protein
MKNITLDFDYTRNGVVEWAKGVAHDATDELRQLLASGVAGLEREAETVASEVAVALPEAGAAIESAVQVAEGSGADQSA